MSVMVNDKTFHTKVLESSKPALVEFYSNGCLACKEISPVLGDLEESYEEKIDIFKVNAQFSEKLAEKYQVSVYPTILIFDSGKETARYEGIVEQQLLEQEIEKHVQGEILK